MAAESTQPPSHPWHKITRREAQVAVLLGRGLSYPEIGKELGISASTARHHAERLAAKFDGRMTEKERKAGSQFLIIAWVSGLKGKLGERTAEELELLCAQAEVTVTLALDELARRNTPSEKRREA